MRLKMRPSRMLPRSALGNFLKMTYRPSTSSRTDYATSEASDPGLITPLRGGKGPVDSRPVSSAHDERSIVYFRRENNRANYDILSAEGSRVELNLGVEAALPEQPKQCSISMKKYTTFMIGVMQLGAKWANATTEEQESLGCSQHPE